MVRTYVGIDCEMSGTDVWQHQLIQIGISLDARKESQNFVSDVGWTKGAYRYDPESLQVNGFDFARIESGPHAYKVEAKILEFFEENHVPPGTVIPVGFAVGRFDMPFIKITFPNIMHYFVAPKANPNAWRVIDLTVVADAFQFGHIKNEWGFSGWKHASKRYAEAQLEKVFVNPQWHDAGYDARAALLSLEFFSNQKVQPKGE